MKLFFTLIVFITTCCPIMAQNNCDLKIVNDNLANIKTAFTPAVVINNETSKMDLNFWRTGKFIVFSALISGDDLFCVDNISVATVQFTDRTTTTLTATNTANCTGSFQSFLSNITFQNEIDALAAKAIVVISLKGKNATVVFRPSTAQSIQLKNYFNCLKQAEL